MAETHFKAAEKKPSFYTACELVPPSDIFIFLSTVLSGRGKKKRKERGAALGTLKEKVYLWTEVNKTAKQSSHPGPACTA